MKKKSEKGFSILEVLIGISIFAVGLLGLMALQMSTMRTLAFSGNLTEATSLAVAKIEKLKRLSTFGHADLTDSAGGCSGGSNGDAGLDYNCNCNVDASCTTNADHYEINKGKNGIYKVYWNVWNNEPETNLKTINVIVTWPYKESIQQMNLLFIWQ